MLIVAGLIGCGTALSIALRKPPEGCGPVGGRSVCRTPKQARLKDARTDASTRRSRASFLRPSYGPITQWRFSGLPLTTNATVFFVRYASYRASGAAVHTRPLIVLQIILASIYNDWYSFPDEGDGAWVTAACSRRSRPVDAGKLPWRDDASYWSNGANWSGR